MAEELPLTISWKAVADFFCCPVCMCELKATHVTNCGHRYCEKCIRECVDIHRKCPCCNKPLRQADVIRDPHYDELMAVATNQKNISEKKYFDNLIDAASENTTNNNTSDGTTQPMKRVLSPIETVLKEHLKKSLVSHELYYQKLKGEFECRRKQIEDKFLEEKRQLYEQGLCAIDTGQKLSALRSEADEKSELLTQDLERCGLMVAQAFDAYLTEHVPSLSVLPITVSLNILNKSIKIPDITIQPHHTLSDIKLLLRQQMEARGDRIVEFADDVVFLSFGPLSKWSLYEMHRMAQDMVELGATHTDIALLWDDSIPIMQYHIKPGSDLAIYGRIQCESDMPKQCFSTTFEAGQDQAIDYFSCKDCKFNWVCRPCMESCHKEHNVVPYIMNHSPTWACCYCPKKKKCVLQRS